MKNTHAQRLKILHIIGGLNLGGTERQLYLTVKHLDSERYEHHILVLNPHQNYFISSLEDMGARIWPMPTDRKSRGARFLYILQLAGSLKPQAIHSWTFYANLYAGLAGVLAGVPLRIGSQRSADSHYAFLSALTRWLAAHTVQRILVNSRAALSDMKPGDYSTGQLLYFPNVVDIQKSDSVQTGCNMEGIRAGSVVIGMIGNLRRLKNHALFIAGVARLSVNWDIQAVIVGQPVQDDPDLLNEILENIRSRGLQERILYAGFRSDIPNVLRQINIFCLTSDYEGMPNVVLEAMAAGRPIVATRVGDVPEVVRDGVNGFLIDPGDLDGFVKAVERLLLDPGLALKMGAAGQEIVRQHAPEEALRGLSQLYELKGVY